MEFDGRQCWECLNRSEAVSETVAIFSVVFGAGLLTEIVAYGLYPPLTSNFWLFWDFPILVAVIAVTAFVLAMTDRMDRYATPFRALFALASTLPLLITAFYFLNGCLDKHAGVGVPASVIDKGIADDGDGEYFVVRVNFVWNQKELEASAAVGGDVYDAVRPGQTVKFLVHPGLFSVPWSGKGLLTTGHDSIALDRSLPQ